MSSPSSSSSLDSLFDTPPLSSKPLPASLSTPPIQGLYVFPSLLPFENAYTALSAIVEANHFASGTRDQAMFFTSPSDPSSSSLPAHITGLLRDLLALLRPLLPSEIYGLVGDQCDISQNERGSRQVILNLYRPGVGIAAHIDLPNRYADGVLGVSLVGGCTMTFSRWSGASWGSEGREEERYQVYLPPRSVYVLSGEARWAWLHGIEGREEDLVESEDGGRAKTVVRETRVSATFRWMKEGGDILC